MEINLLCMQALSLTTILHRRAREEKEHDVSRGEDTPPTETSRATHCGREVPVPREEHHPFRIIFD